MSKRTRAQEAPLEVKRRVSSGLENTFKYIRPQLSGFRGIQKHTGEFSGAECRELSHSGLGCEDMFQFPSIIDKGKKVDCTSYCKSQCEEWLGERWERYCWRDCGSWLGKALQTIPRQVRLTWEGEGKSRVIDVARNGNPVVTLKTTTVDIRVSAYSEWNAIPFHFNPLDKYDIELGTDITEDELNEQVQQRPYLSETKGNRDNSLPGWYSPGTPHGLSKALCPHLAAGKFKNFALRLRLQTSRSDMDWLSQQYTRDPTDRVLISFPEFSRGMYLGRNDRWRYSHADLSVFMRMEPPA